MPLRFARRRASEVRRPGHAGNIVVVNDRHRCIAMQCHKFRSVIGVRRLTFFDFVERTHLVLKRYGISARQNFPDQLIPVSVVGEKITQAGDQFVVRASCVLRDVAVDPVSGEMVRHAFWIAMVPGIKITFYKFCRVHERPSHIRHSSIHPIAGLREMSFQIDVCAGRTAGQAHLLAWLWGFR